MNERKNERTNKQEAKNTLKTKKKFRGDKALLFL